MRRRCAGLPEITALTMLFTLTRAHVESYDTNFAEQDHVSVDEFQEPAKTSFLRGKSRVSVLLDGALSGSWMPKTPGYAERIGKLAYSGSALIIQADERDDWHGWTSGFFRAGRK